MRALRLLVVSIGLAAAACTGTPSPTPEPPTASPVPAATAEVTQELPFSELATNAADNAILITPQIPGTLSVIDHSSTPNYTPEALQFDLVQLVRSGGIAGQTLQIRLSRTGALEVDGTVVTTVDAATVEQIRVLLDNIHFYDMTGAFTGPNAQPDAYRYSIAVLGPRGAYSVEAQDGYIPPELQSILDAILVLVPPQP
ncbi:MAG: protealysin inhibitor emfourin [Anaerolineae bacterium]